MHYANNLYLDGIIIAIMEVNLTNPIKKLNW